MQQADYVAWNLWAAINGRTLLPFKYQHLGTMLTFGRTSGAVKLNVPLPQRTAPSPDAASGPGLWQSCAPRHHARVHRVHCASVPRAHERTLRSVSLSLNPPSPPS